MANAHAEQASATTNKRPKGSYSLSDALTNGQTHFKIRFRDEYAHSQLYRQGNALTLQTLLGYESASVLGFRAGLELNGVSAAHTDRFNSGDDANKTQYTPIMDPKGAAITNGYIAYDRLPDTDIIVGRQYIDLNTQRFFGRNDFRQNPQTFDAITVQNTSSPVTLFYAYVRQYNSGLYNDQLETNHEDRLNTHLFNAVWDNKTIGRLAAYGYLVDDKVMPQYNSDTFGARFDSHFDLNQLNVGYGLEYANQTSEYPNPVHYHARYIQAQLVFTSQTYYTKFAYELLGADSQDQIALQTPYASNHNFLGDSDAFVVTPNIGVQDASTTIGSNLSVYDVSATYHYFKSDHHNVDLGKEWDIAIKKTFAEHYYASIAFADFNSDATAYAVDTEKWWLTVGAAF